MLNDINGYTRTCGLIGNPVEHTLSPVIHNTLSMVLGKNLAYVPFHVENGRLEDAVKGAFALNLLGCYVHDLRLQCLEFFKNFYQDGGKPFRPLDLNTKYYNVVKD